ncbi:glycoside hydrolase family 13 protein [Oceanobacillus sp. CFH 90083]|uniref:glycoside hydrolase family 13 protein n=1 Tax=Oceanobacillus sp. CFH 90083 TaxID=2592336 RepID=UPI00128DB6DA|nr:glycoside hydrolase family 13 protein [Oceanobacillus sp. CFH 90083]
MPYVYYNSWKSDYKKPFGAVQPEEKVTFQIDFHERQVIEVQFIIRKENGVHEEKVYSMRDIGEKRFSCIYTPHEGKGLYFYYFVLKWQDDHGKEHTAYWGGSPVKGEGQLYQEQHEIIPYQLTCFAKEEKTPDWYREAVFYQIFPDRFYNGNADGKVNAPKRNSFIYGDTRDTPLYVRGSKGEILRWDFYGGNLEGIRKKIPYLKDLGINAIYLNPIFQAASNHRYDTADYMKIDPVLGDEVLFQEIMEDLHAEGIHVILDGVFSHVGRNSIYFNYDGTYGEDQGAYQNPDSPYYPWFTFSEYPDKYASWWGIDDLPEVDKSNEAFQDYIYQGDGSVIDRWSDVDGWRLDVADELPDEFISGIRQKLDQYPEKVLIGEVWEDASNKIAYEKRRQYILGDHLHGVMNYPFRNTVLDLLQLEKSPKELARRLTQLQENYPKDILFNNLNNIGTHDTKRIYTLVGEDKERLKLALSFLLIAPGVPCIYYGDEAGVTGEQDPDNRKFFPWENIDQDIFKHCQQWIAERKQNSTLKYGDFVLFYTDDVLGMLRFTDKEYTIYMINPHDVEKTCHFTELHFLREIPLTEKVLKDIFNNLLIDGKSDFFVTGKI